MIKDHTKVADVIVGDLVSIATGQGAMQGRVDKILTTRDNRKGIKVELHNGERGRVIAFISEKDLDIAIPESEKKEEHKVLSDIKEHTVIEIKDTDIQINEEALFSEEDSKDFEVVTKFFREAYIRKIKNNVYGIVIFKVKAFDLNIAVYKINLYLKTYCVSKDIKYEVIKSTSK